MARKRKQDAAVAPVAAPEVPVVRAFADADGVHAGTVVPNGAGVTPAVETVAPAVEQPKPLPAALASLVKAPVAPVVERDEVLWLTPYRSPDEACGKPTGKVLTPDERADVIARLRLMGSGAPVQADRVTEIQPRARGYLVVIRNQQFAVVGK